MDWLISHSQDYNNQLLPLSTVAICAADKEERPRSIKNKHRFSIFKLLYRILRVAGLVIFLRHQKNRVLPFLIIKNKLILHLKSHSLSPAIVLLSRFQHPAISYPYVEIISLGETNQAEKKTGQQNKPRH